jgi:hypothetical protein
MLPNVTINFNNGLLGGNTPMADGVCALVCNAAEVSTTFVLGSSYLLRSLDSLTVLGVTSANNAMLYKAVKEFYDEAGDGAELWVMGVSTATALTTIVDKDAGSAGAKTLIQQANGRIRSLAVLVSEAPDSESFTIALQKAQQLAAWATTTLYAPIVILLQNPEYTTETALPDLTTNSYNRVAVLIGDTASNSEVAALGLLLGRISKSPVQRHIGRVRDGAVQTTQIFIGVAKPELTDLETINNKGFITFRTFTGRAGYYFTEDCLATLPTDDYNSLARRRIIDKAYRIAYNTMLNNVNEEIPVTASGTIVPAMAKSIETEIESAIIRQMAAEGNLGIDQTDDNDTGVKCIVDLEQNIISTGQINIDLKVKPYGYAKYININLGLSTQTI